MGRFVKTIPAKDLPAGKMAGVDVEGRRVLLSNIDGKVYAVSALCTHEEADLSEGTMHGTRVLCPFHGSEFDLRTGEVFNPPAESPLAKFGVRIGDGYIFVEI